MSNTYCVVYFILFVFVLFLVVPTVASFTELSVLDCPFLIVPLIFSSVYLLCLSSSCFLLYPMLPVLLDCPFLIVPLIFSSVYLHTN